MKLKSYQGYDIMTLTVEERSWIDKLLFRPSKEVVYTGTDLKWKCGDKEVTGKKATDLQLLWKVARARQKAAIRSLRK